MRAAVVSSSILVGLVFLAACGATVSGGDGSSSGTSGSSGFSSSGDLADGGSSGGASGGPSCATGETAALREPVYIDIILDGSRSMDGHGSKNAGCDDTYPPPGSASTCFVANARETDPLVPDRSLKVCHDEGDSVSSCPSFRGLTGKKWLAVRGALLAFFDAAKERGDTRFGLGMYLFGSEVQRPNDAWDVEPAFVDDAQLDELRKRILPPNFPTSSGTPLKGSMNGQAPLLLGYTAKPPLEPNGKRVFVIVTDGAATDCSRNDCRDIVDRAAELREGTPSITTFVIGVGDPAATDDSVYNETFLSRLAKAGGAAPEGCNENWDGQNPTGTPCHFQITPGEKSAAQIQAELSAAMNAIAASVQSCELALNKTSPIDPAKVNVVYVDGAGGETQIPKDPANGWGYDDENDPSKVILHGSACEALKGDPSAKVTIVIGCPTGTDVR